MKRIVCSTFACAAVACMVPSVHGNTTIRITGSTAFRALVYNALNNNFFTGSPTVTAAKISGGVLVTDTPGTGSSIVTFTGTSPLFSGTTTVEAAYSGSVEGLINVLHDSTASPVAQPPFLLPGAGVNADPVTQADLAFSDVAQDTTSFVMKTYGALPEIKGNVGKGVGVVSFALVKNDNEAANSPSVSNITSAQLFQLLSNGTLSRGFFTGNSTDTTAIYVAGRYSFSGTRLVVGAVSGIGATAGQTLYCQDGTKYNSGSNTGQPGDGTIPAADNVNVASDGGFISGGTLATLLHNTTDSDSFVAYLGLGDVTGAKTVAGSSVSLESNVLSLDGVLPTRATIISGSYALWSYERVYADKNKPTGDHIKFMTGNSASLSGNYTTANTFLKALDTELKKTVTGTANNYYISNTQMKASKTSDGARPSPGF